MACVLLAYFEDGFEVGDKGEGEGRGGKEAEMGKFGNCGWGHCGG